MANFSNWSEENLLKYLFGGTPAAAPSAWYVALYTTATDDASGGTEVTGGGYARAAHSNWTIEDSGGGAWRVVNATAVTFSVATGDWSAGAPITHARVLDAPTAGNPTIHGALTDQTKTVSNGETVTFAPGALVFNVD